MEQTLKLIKELTVIIAIYLYFIAWVYVNFYYQQFGISTESIKIDYTSYLMYSYNVVTSARFIFWVKLFGMLVLLKIAAVLLITRLKKKYVFFQKLYDFLSGNFVTLYLRKLNQQYSLLVLIIFLVIIFPLFFRVARQVALDNYREDRIHTENLKSIQFIFRKNTELMSPTAVLDSTLSPDHIFYSDITVIKNDQQQILRLLAESEKYYIVLQQRPLNKKLKVLPSGYVYYIDKQDILLSKIILRSL